MLKHALLGFLSLTSMTGYELKQTLDFSTSHIWHAKQSQIYTTLKKLEEEGLLTSLIVPQEERPDRRVYTITKSGQTELQDWLQKPLTQVGSQKDPFLLKMFFSMHTSKEGLLTQVRIIQQLKKNQMMVYQDHMSEGIQRFVSKIPSKSQEKDKKNSTLLWEMLRDLAERSTQVYIEWLDDALDKIENEFAE